MRQTQTERLLELMRFAERPVTYVWLLRNSQMLVRKFDKAVARLLASGELVRCVAVDYDALYDLPKEERDRRVAAGTPPVAAGFSLPPLPPPPPPPQPPRG